MISSLKSTIYFLFQKKSNTLKGKCEKLLQKFYSIYKGQIDYLREKLKKTPKLLANNQQTKQHTNNLLLKDTTVVI